MSIAQIDPEYYAADVDDEGRRHEPHGYWLLSPKFDRQRRIWWETKQEVDAGRASWVRLERIEVPF